MSCPFVPRQIVMCPVRFIPAFTCLSARFPPVLGTSSSASCTPLFVFDPPLPDLFGLYCLLVLYLSLFGLGSVFELVSVTPTTPWIFPALLGSPVYKLLLKPLTTNLLTSANPVCPCMNIACLTSLLSIKKKNFLDASGSFVLKPYPASCLKT